MDLFPEGTPFIWFMSLSIRTFFLRLLLLSDSCPRRYGPFPWGYPIYLIHVVVDTDLFPEATLFIWFMSLLRWTFFLRFITFIRFLSSSSRTFFLRLLLLSDSCPPRYGPFSWGYHFYLIPVLIDGAFSSSYQFCIAWVPNLQNWLVTMQHFPSLCNSSLSWFVEEVCVKFSDRIAEYLNCLLHLNLHKCNYGGTPQGIYIHHSDHTLNYNKETTGENKSGIVLRHRKSNFHNYQPPIRSISTMISHQHD